MSDRNYTIEVLLDAKDRMAAAFAQATAELESYNKLLDQQQKQVAKTDAAQKEYARSFEQGRSGASQQADALEKLRLKNIDTVKALNQVEQAQRAVTKAEQSTATTDAQRVLLLERLTEAQKEYSKALQTAEEGYSPSGARNRANTDAQKVASQIRVNAAIEQEAEESRKAQAAAEQQAKEYARQQAIKEASDREWANASKDLLNQVNALAEQRHQDTLRRLKDGDAAESQARQQSINREKAQSAFEAQAAKDAANVRVKAEQDADKLISSARNDVSRYVEKGGSRPSALTVAAARTNTGTGDVVSDEAVKTVGTSVNDVQRNVSELGGSFTKIFSSLGPTLIQPAITALVGLAGTFASIGSAAIAAGSALGTTFLSAIAQGIPALGLFAAAGQRLSGVMSLVSGELGVQQQKFLAQYQAAYQSRLGINQVAEAQHQYSDALYAQSQSYFQVQVAQRQYSDALNAQKQSIIAVQEAQLALATAREEAARQLQALTLQEEQAKLAAQASSLAVTDAQKSLLAAISSGGDVQEAQLNVAQAHVSHQQSVAQANQAITDAGKNSLARQNIQESVKNAQNGLDQARRATVDASLAVVEAQKAITQAQRGVVDARVAAVEAKAALTEAQQAQSGFNISTAAQMAYLRSQMTQTEISLAGNIAKIFKLFQGAHGILTPMTNAILAPFIGISGRIYDLLQNNKILRPLQGLADAIGDSITRVSKVFLDPKGIQTFIGIINDATDNMKPLASIVSSIFTIMGNIIKASAPFVHQFATYLQQLIGNFASWTSSQKGKNWLRDWFTEAFKALKAFINLGVSLGELVAAIIGIGGGAKTGIGLLDDFRKKIDDVTDSIKHHGKAYQDLQKIWGSIRPVLSALGQIFGALGHALLQIGGTKQGQDALKNIAGFIANTLIPALSQFVIEMGKVASAVTKFLDNHPKLASMLGDIAAYVLILGGLGKIIGAVVSPLKHLFDVLSSLHDLIGKMSRAKKLKLLDPDDEKDADSLTSKLKGFVKGAAGGIAAPVKKIYSKVRGGAGEAGEGAEAGEVGAEGAEAASGASGAEAFGAVAGPIGAVVAGLLLIIKWTGTLKNLWDALKAPFVEFWQQIKQPIQQLAGQFEYMLKPIGGVRGAIKGLGDVAETVGGILRKYLGQNLRVMFKTIQDLFGGIAKFVGSQLGAAIKVLGDSFKIIGDLMRGNLKALPGDFLKLGKDIVTGFLNGLKDLGQLVLNIFIDSWHGILAFFGIASPSKKGASLGQSIVDGIKNGVAALPHLFLTLGENMIKQLIKGMGNLATQLKNKLESLIPKPLRDAAGAVSNVAGKAASTVGHAVGSLIPGGQTGGPIDAGNYGGGDRHLTLLESGEHVMTKEEVRAAGGHGNVYAMRRSLGGGGQGGPIGFAAGGTPGTTGTSSGGSYQLPTVGYSYTPTFDVGALQKYLSAQQSSLANMSTDFTDNMNQFLKNWELVAGDNGLFAQAAQALQNFVTQQQATVELAAAGLKVSSSGTISQSAGGPQTALQQAQTDLKSTNEDINQTNQLQKTYQAGLAQVNRQISNAKAKGLTNTKQYKQLIGSRNQLITDIDNNDQQLGQYYTDQYNKAVTLFQAQWAQRNRGTGTIQGPAATAVTTLGAHGGLNQKAIAAVGDLKGIGPAISSGIISMAQTIAQTFGNMAELVGPQGLDQKAITVAKETQANLQKEYDAAAQKAKNDPRWQSVADDLLTQLESATQAVAEAQAQQLADAITQVQNSQTLQQANIQMRSTIAQAMGQFSGAGGNPAGQFSSIGQQIAISQSNVNGPNGLNQQLAQYQQLLTQAQGQGNVAAEVQLKQSIDDLKGQIVQANLQTQQLITSYQQLAVTITDATSSATSSYVQSATGIITTLGQITGSLNLPQQVQALTEYGNDLVTQGQSAVQNIMNTISGAGTGGVSAFGAAAGTANSWLSQAATAFNQGPTMFSSWLAQNAGGLSQFQAGLPQDQQQLFQQLIGALVDNTTSTTQNTLSLQQLEGGLNQQDYATAAWSQFRDAIFNGLGQLLPQYAMTVPAMDVGGQIKQSGVIYGHAGETITPAVVTKPYQNQAPKQEFHTHVTNPTEVADPVYLGNKMAWSFNHNPNSR